jgi:hypothetical protein
MNVFYKFRRSISVSWLVIFVIFFASTSYAKEKVIFSGEVLYAGPLVRYYTNEWESINQQFAKLENKDYKITRPKLKQLVKNKTKNQLLSESKKWANGIAGRLSDNKKFKPWVESFEGEYNSRNIMPILFSIGQEYEEKTKQKLQHIYLNYLIPLDHTILLEYKDISEKKIIIGTTKGFIDELNKLSQFYLNKPIYKLSSFYSKPLPDDLDYINSVLCDLYSIAFWAFSKNYPMLVDEYHEIE